MKCTQCGAGNPDDGFVCEACGQPLRVIRHNNRTRTIFLVILNTFLILIVIAALLPNPLGEGTITKFSQTSDNQRAMAIALETYYLDHHAYPAWSARKEENAFGALRDPKGLLNGLPTFRLPQGSTPATLTTPVAYMEKNPLDVFSPIKNATYCYWVWESKATTETGWILWSPGYDGDYDLTLENIAQAYTPQNAGINEFLVNRTYDPSNGSYSGGDKYRLKE